MAAASGVGFGLFQSVNVRALRRTDDTFAATFVQLCVAAVALVVASVAAGEAALLAEADLGALAYFATAGLLHFLAGWSMLNLSQKRIGAARTSPLLTTTPLFGVLIAAVTLGQMPGPVALMAIAVISLGAYVVAARGGAERIRTIDALPALGCAFLWALSPVFTLQGFETVASPILGVTIGLVASVALYLPVFMVVRGAGAWRSVVLNAPSWKILAGLLVAAATLARWIALEDVTIGAVVALQLLSVPVVLVLAPVIAGRRHERVTRNVWVGSALVVAGSLVLILI